MQENNLLNLSSQDEKDDPLKLVEKVKSSVQKYRANFEPNWAEEEKAVLGDIWEAGEFRPYENHIFEIIEGEVPILTDQIPGAAISTKSVQFEPQVAVLNAAVEWVNKDQDFPMMRSEVTRKSLHTGNGYIHQYYDANDANGEGRIIREILHWKHVWIGGKSLKTADKVRLELKRTKEWLKLNYSKYAKQIDKENPDKSPNTDNTYEGLSLRDAKGPYAKRKVPVEWCDDNLLTLVKTYIKDYSLEPIPEDVTNEEILKETEALANGESPDVNKWQDHNAHIMYHGTEDMGILYSQLGLTPEAGYEAAEMAAQQLAMQNPEGGFDTILAQIKVLEMHIQAHQVLLEENPNGERMKYPGGYRLIETVGKTVLYDGKNPHNHLRIPLVQYQCYPTGTAYAHGEVRNILDSQRMASTLAYGEYMALRLVANPQKRVDIETGLTEKDFTNDPDAIYFTPKGTAIEQIPPGIVSEQVGNFHRERITRMQSISGITEATQGKTPAPNASGVTVERLQTQAIGRIRLKDRQNEYSSDRELWYLTCSDVLQFWTAEKVLKLEKTPEGMKQIIFNPLDMQDVDYDVEIAQGSMAGVDKEAYNGLLANLLSAGHLTFDEYLQVAEMPKKEKIRELIKVRMDQEAIIGDLQNQVVELKGSISPELLNPEEQKIFQSLQQQKQLGVITGNGAM